MTALKELNFVCVEVAGGDVERIRFNNMHGF